MQISKIFSLIHSSRKRWRMHRRPGELWWPPPLCSAFPSRPSVPPYVTTMVTGSDVSLQTCCRRSVTILEPTRIKGWTKKGLSTPNGCNCEKILRTFDFGGLCPQGSEKRSGSCGSNRNFPQAQDQVVSVLSALRMIARGGIAITKIACTVSSSAIETGLSGTGGMRRVCCWTAAVQRSRGYPPALSCTFADRYLLSPEFSRLFR